MSNPNVYDSDGGFVGTWDKTNGILEIPGSQNMTVDSDGTVYDDNGYVGQIDRNGRIS